MTALSNKVGLAVDNSIIIAIASADDLILLALTNKGLQTLLDSTYDLLGKLDLKINAANCLSLDKELAQTRNITYSVLQFQGEGEEDSSAEKKRNLEVPRHRPNSNQQGYEY